MIYLSLINLSRVLLMIKNKKYNRHSVTEQHGSRRYGGHVENITLELIPETRLYDDGGLFWPLKLRMNNEPASRWFVFGDVFYRVLYSSVSRYTDV